MSSAHPRSHSLRNRWVAFVAAFLLLTGLSTLAAVGVSTSPAQAAPGDMDLVTSFTGPTENYIYGEFTYSGRVINQGPSAADGSTIRITAPDASTELAVRCTAVEATEVAVTCPTFSSDGLVWTATVGAWPKGAVLRIALDGRYPRAAKSATASLEAQPGPGQRDTDPTSNLSNQSYPLDNEADVTAAVSVEKETMRPGDTNRVTFTWVNTGPSNIETGTAEANVAGIRALIGTYDQTCAGTGGATGCQPLLATDRPLDTDEFANGKTGFNMPRGTSVTTTVEFTVDPAHCSPNPELPLSIRTQFQLPGDYSIRFSNLDVASITVLDIPPCPRADISVTKTADKDHLAVGEDMTYTITVANRGTVDVPDVQLFDSMKQTIRNGWTHGAHSEFVFRCEAQGTTCPSDISTTGGRQTGLQANSTTWFIGNPDTGVTASLPAGSQITLTMTYQLRPFCWTGGGPMDMENTISAESSRFDLGTVEATHHATQEVPACPEGVIDVQSEYSVDGAPIGPGFTILQGTTVTAETVYRNTGTTDVEGLNLALFSRSHQRVSGTVTCLPASEVPCWDPPTRFDFPMIGETTNPTGVVDLPAGKKLVVRYEINQTGGSCNVEGRTPVAFGPTWYGGPGLTHEPGSQAGSPIAGSAICTDLTTEAVITPAEPTAGARTTLTATVRNASGNTTDVPFRMTIPARGFTPDTSDPNSWCTSASDTPVAQCPTDLTVTSEPAPLTRAQRLLADPATSDLVVLSGTIPRIDTGGTLTIAMPGTASTLPAKVASFRVRAEVTGYGELTPASNVAEFSFGLRNTQTTAAARMTLDSPAPQAMTFPVTVTCDLEGPFHATVTIPAGGTTGTVQVTDQPWLNDTCSATITAPTAPAGYSWSAWSPSDQQTVAPVSGPFTVAFARSLVKDTAPTGPSTPTTPPTSPPGTATASPSPTDSTQSPSSSPSPTGGVQSHTPSTDSSSGPDPDVSPTDDPSQGPSTAALPGTGGPAAALLLGALMLLAAGAALVWRTRTPRTARRH